MSQSPRTMTPDGIIDCEVCLLQRYTAQDFVIFVGGERAGTIRLGTGIPCEIGYEIDGRFRGRGIATAAVKGLCEAVFAAGVVKRIIARPDNDASARVLHKAGFHGTVIEGRDVVYVRDA